jgi:ferritin
MKSHYETMFDSLTLVSVSMTDVRFFIKRFLDTDNIHTLKRAKEGIEKISESLDNLEEEADNEKDDISTMNEMKELIKNMRKSFKETEDIIVEIEAIKG